MAFWLAPGVKLDFETDPGSGQLVASNGTRLFIAETSPEDPVFRIEAPTQE